MSEDLSSRRGLLRHALTRAGRIVRDRDLALVTEPLLPRARGSTRTATLDQLLAAADELGLGARHDELIAATRSSVQLTPTPYEDGPVSFGGAARLAQGVEWPSFAGRPLTLMAQIDLAALGGTGLPFEGRGTLAFFFDTASMPPGLDPADRGAGRVLHATSSTPASGPSLPRRSTSGAAAVELMIPRVWSARIDALELDDQERDAWELLRERLSQDQGTALTEQIVSSSQVSHRVLGYPEDTIGDMPLICELCDRGHRVDGHALTHPAAAEAELAADRWELLAQFSRDTELDWSWGGGIARIYFWIDRAQLAAGDLSRVWIIAR